MSSQSDLKVAAKRQWEGSTKYFRGHKKWEYTPIQVEEIEKNAFLAGSAHIQVKESKIRRELQDHLRESNRGNERISLRLEKQVEYSLELKKKLTIAEKKLEEAIKALEGIERIVHPTHEHYKLTGHICGLETIAGDVLKHTDIALKSLRGKR